MPPRQDRDRLSPDLAGVKPPERPAKFKFIVSLQERIRKADETPRLLGTKGHRLLIMGREGFPVPEGFIATTNAWREFMASGEKDIPEAVWQEMLLGLQTVEKNSGRKFGSSENPLLVSARSGSEFSMPGKMATILNIGLTERSFDALAREIGPKAALLAKFELLRGFAIHVYNIDEDQFKQLKNSVTTEKSEEDLRTKVQEAEEILRLHGHELPQDPYMQLRLSASAIFRSWNSDIAKTHRQKESIPDVGTAVTVQRMVFGTHEYNISGSGVIMTRNPRTNDPMPVVVFAPNSQGFAVVEEDAKHQAHNLNDLIEDLQAQLGPICTKAESLFKYPQQLEFTVERGKVWTLQSRDERLLPLASFRRILEGFVAGHLTKREAIKLLGPTALEALLLPSISPAKIAKAKENGTFVETGIPISIGGFATARVVNSIEEAERLRDEKVLLLMQFSMIDMDRIPRNVRALLLKNGCIGSHIALEAERIAKYMPVVFGITGENLISGEIVTVDGATGTTIRGKVKPSLQEGSVLLTKPERQKIKSFLKEAAKNPWDLATPLSAYSEKIRRNLTDKARTLLEKARQRGIISHKAQEALIATLLFKDIALSYKILKPNRPKPLRKLLLNIIKSGHDATVRTCHHPAMKGSAPYVIIRTEGDIDSFFTNPEYSKYGGYQRLSTETNPTELLVGGIPKGKLDRENFPLHCAAILKVTRRGDVVFQMHPYSPLLRDAELAEKDDIITYKVSFNPAENRYGDIEIVTGKNLINDKTAREWAKLLLGQVIISDWWNMYNLPEVMASIADAFPPNCSTPTLEIQARGNPDGTLADAWVYGIKADEPS